MKLLSIVAITLFVLTLDWSPAVAQGSAKCQNACQARCSSSKAKGNCMDRCVASCPKR
jgi:hypothetical protein